MNDTPIISLERMSFRYNELAPMVLDEMSAAVPRGGITAILGPNGSGKSTLLHLLLGLLAPTSGSVYVDGYEPSVASRRELSRIVGLVPQNEHVTFDLTVHEYALLGRAPYLGLLHLPSDEDRLIALRAVETVGIGNLALRAVPTLSGGERQLATIARALAQDPAVLLLDEPTSHLDLANAQRILRLLRGLRRDGRTIVFATHDPNAATAIADQVLLMRDGHLLGAGPVADVMTSALLGATYGVPVKVASYKGGPLVLTHDLD